jgi:hypothetical protein
MAREAVLIARRRHPEQMALFAVLAQIGLELIFAAFGYKHPTFYVVAWGSLLVGRSLLHRQSPDASARAPH